MDLLKLINKDIDLYHLTYQKLIINIIIFVYKLRNKINKHIYWYLIGGLIILLIKNELNKNKVTLSTEYDNKYKIIRIKNSRKINKNNHLVLIMKFLLLLSNFNIYKQHKSIDIFFLNQSFSDVIFRIPKNMVFPNKFILLFNHTINSETIDNNMISIYRKIVPDYKFCIITNIKLIFKKITNTDSFYFIKGIAMKKIYQDIFNIINTSSKIIIFIIPEGISPECNIKYNNEENMPNFNIINKDGNISKDEHLNNKNNRFLRSLRIATPNKKNKLFNYRAGAFVMSLMSNIPVCHGILYTSMPNYKYTLSHKNLEHNIKHINHSGIHFYKPEIYSKKIPFTKELTDENILQYIDENKDHIEKYRSIMEQKYITRYFDTLVEAHKYN
jgi:hypothetical protein